MHFVEICQNVVNPSKQNKENEVVEIMQRLHVQMPKTESVDCIAYEAKCQVKCWKSNSEPLFK